MWSLPRPPVPTMATRTSSLAPRARRLVLERNAAAPTAADPERKRLRLMDMVGTFRWLEGERSVGDYTEGRTIVLRKSDTGKRAMRLPVSGELRGWVGGLFCFVAGLGFGEGFL